MKRNSLWLSVTLTLTLVFNFLVTSKSIEAKQNQVSEVKETGEMESSKGKPQMYFIPTNDPEKADEVIKQLQQGKSPKELGLISDQQHAPRKQTLEQMASEAAKSKKTYPVKMDLVKTADAGDDWTPPPFEYDDIQFDACVENENASKGWIKNHYSYCWSNYIVYSDPAGCGPSSFPFFCDWVSFRLTVIGNGYNGQRTVSYNYKVDDIQTDLDSRGWIGSKVSVSIKCDGISENRDCLGDDSPTTRTLAQWRSNDDGSTIFDSDPPPITAGNKDQVSFMDLWPRVTIDPPGNKYPPLTEDGPKEKIRMDSADYMFVFNPNFYPKEGAIFANVQPVFYYDMNNSYFNIMTEAFQHHKDALTSPGSLIPGIQGRPPLTRLYSKYDSVQYNANRKAKDAACSKLSKPEGYECDEFPFASTYEGAGAGDGRFSVRYIPRAANNTHGRWLAAWYAYDRILHKDQFYIGFNE
ncbi:NucA/NucB deoxyribonuclease domain-containing protein [Peribacillus simplex]|uniref:NucA/NucB deoxyribonuclease domain-containing protein n=1 Tax=Peribacillus simplex TaxID=1478 RepID=UPI003D2B8723